MILVIYLASLIQSVIALHNLINNKVISLDPDPNKFNFNISFIGLLMMNSLTKQKPYHLLSYQVWHIVYILNLIGHVSFKLNHIFFWMFQMLTRSTEKQKTQNQFLYQQQREANWRVSTDFHLWPMLHSYFG